MPHLNPKSIACCSDGHECNRRLAPMYTPTPPDMGDDNGEGQMGGGGGRPFGVDIDPTASLILIVSVTVFLCKIIRVCFSWLRLNMDEIKAHQQDRGGYFSST